jgi:hypothetical protein
MNPASSFADKLERKVNFYFFHDENVDKLVGRLQICPGGYFDVVIPGPVTECVKGKGRWYARTKPLSQCLVFPADRTIPFTAAQEPGPLTYGDEMSKTAIRVTRGPLSVLLYKHPRHPPRSSFPAEDVAPIQLGTIPTVDWSLILKAVSGHDDESKATLLFKPDGNLELYNVDKDFVLTFPYTGTPVTEEKKVEVQNDTFCTFAGLQRDMAKDPTLPRLTGVELVAGKTVTFCYGPGIRFMAPDITVEKSSRVNLPEELGELAGHLRQLRDMLGENREGEGDSGQCAQQ